MVDGPAITWTELGATLGGCAAVFSVISAWIWRSQSTIWKAMEGNRQRIEQYRIEMARDYATVAVVMQVEKRLIENIDRLSGQVNGSLARIENTFMRWIEISHVKKDG